MASLPALALAGTALTLGSTWSAFSGATRNPGNTWSANVPAVALSQTVFKGPFPVVVTGSLSGFTADEAVTYRLDAATALTGSPSAVGSGGAAAITSLSVPSAADGPHTVHVIGANGSQASVAITVDTVAPTVSATLSPAANGNGWNSTSPVQVTLAGDDGTGTGVHRIYYTTDGSDPTSSGTVATYAAPINVASTRTVRYYAVDVAGNASAVAARTVNIDTTAPSTPALSFSALTNAYWSGSGSTVWYRGGQASGSFTVTASAADAQSGVTSYAMPNLGTGWTTPGTAASQAYAWSSANPAAPGTKPVTATNAAGLVSAAASFTATADNAGPTGGGVDHADGASPATVTVTFSAGTDAGAGVNGTSGTLQRAVATLTGSTCGAFGAFATVTGGTNPASPFSDATPTTGRCYTYQYVVADRLGNTTTYASGKVAKRYATYAAAVSGEATIGRYYRLNESMIVADNMAGTTGTVLQTRPGETGATWTKVGTNGDGIITLNGRVRKGGNGSYGTLYYASGVPPTADYKVEALSAQKADDGNRLGNDVHGLVGRYNSATNTYYLARREHDAGGGYLRLYRVVNGTRTKVGEVGGISVANNGDGWLFLSLDMTGTVIRVLRDGDPVITYNDSTASKITTAGRAGFVLGDNFNVVANTHTDSHGLHFDTIRVTPPMADATGAVDGLHHVNTNLGLTGALSGDTDRSVSYDGANDSSSAARPLLDSFTAEFWFKSAQGLGTYPHWFDGAALVDADQPLAANDWGVSLRADGRVVAGVGNADTSIVSATGGYNDNAWHHVVFTRDTTTGALALYVDGTAQGTATGPTGTRDAGSVLRFGRRAGDGAQAYAGQLDEVAVYTGVLPPATVQSHHNLGRGLG
ncbi:LamG-like jellyroll fold domain-containing protein [Spirilliplanes yamanashiensis]|uniref:LamG-like jellyroll fold domain-containing protein n=1 Tax=Spirilliplanes yamanashiensis TaxID=42233 RepID=UPI00194EEA15|nr:LamG-like jellyroll fold domain-containing protein [Spirilliplanes yamanashiensis]MDP9819375.1 hypothetical protein [Spirilliplanes yamanashiensis]